MVGTHKSLTANVRSCNAELTFAAGNNFIDILNTSTVIPRIKQTTGYLNTPTVFLKSPSKYETV